MLNKHLINAKVEFLLTSELSRFVKIQFNCACCTKVDENLFKLNYLTALYTYVARYYL